MQRSKSDTNAVIRLLCWSLSKFYKYPHNHSLHYYTICKLKNIKLARKVSEIYLFLYKNDDNSKFNAIVNVHNFLLELLQFLNISQFSDLIFLQFLFFSFLADKFWFYFSYYVELPLHHSLNPKSAYVAVLHILATRRMNLMFATVVMDDQLSIGCMFMADTALKLNYFSI